MLSYEELSKNLSNAKTQAAKAQGSLEQADLHLESVKSRIKEAGVEPELLDVAIMDLERDIQKRKTDIQRKMTVLASELQGF